MSFFDWPLASAFYFLQGSTLLALWLAVRLGSGVDFFQLSEKLSNTALIPSWMPRRIFLLLVSKEVYRVAAYSTIPWFFLAAWVESSGYNLWVRGGCSIAVTLFQLGDSCRTTSHRDYLMIYISWALLVSSDFAETAAYGLCVLYILGSGLSKLRWLAMVIPRNSTIHSGDLCPEDAEAGWPHFGRCESIRTEARQNLWLSWLRHLTL